MPTHTEQTIHKPEQLPFLEAICWDLRDVNLLSQDEILNRYERGWEYKGVLVDIPTQELQYIVHLASAKGSWLQTRV